MSNSGSDIDIAALEEFLASTGYKAALERVQMLAGDGSTRSYYRLFLESGTLVLMLGPDAAENGGFLGVAAHLERCNIRVPKVLGVDAEHGWILLEDLGDVNLLGCTLKSESDAERVALLTPVVELLCRMGVEGTAGFSLETGFSPSAYNASVMVDEEGLYFLKEFVTGVLDIEFDRDEVTGEIEALARWSAEQLGAGQGQGSFFLHRDFQSRNVMLVANRWVVIDFQGARPGPLAYDVAAFIFDPYMANSQGVRDRLLKHYRRCLSHYTAVDVGVFDRTLGPVGAFRIMQALGAYGKLGHRFGKPGFLEHSGAALEHLEWFFLRCAATAPEVKTTALFQLVRLCRQKWSQRPAGRN